MASVKNLQSEMHAFKNTLNLIVLSTASFIRRLSQRRQQPEEFVMEAEYGNVVCSFLGLMKGDKT